MRLLPYISMEVTLANMKKLLSYLIIPPDKQLHLWTGLAGGFVISIFIGLWAVLFVMAVSALKEYYDYNHPNIHTYDVWDFVASSIGGLAGYLMFYLVIGM
jgi:hypothetical protein